jgi:outer membrane biosynthesis protein TonB
MRLRRWYFWFTALLIHSLFLLIPVGLSVRSSGALSGMKSLNFEFEPAEAGSSAADLSKSETLPAPRPQNPAMKTIDSTAQTDAPAPVSVTPTEVVSAAQQSSAPNADPEIGWEGESRAILQRQAVEFPRILSASGQETDCEARITVSPLGTVIKVEIIRSSGYTEIDAGVEAALRGYLFARDYGFAKNSSSGIVRFRFRLEKFD